MAASIVAALAVAIGSYWVGSYWARRDLERRFVGIERTLTATTFRLTDPVLRLLADLTQTNILTFSAEGQLKLSTLPQGDFAPVAALPTTGVESVSAWQLGAKDFLIYGFPRYSDETSGASFDRVYVLFDAADEVIVRRRTAMMPLVTGLSTVVMLGSLTLFLTGRLVRRLSVLQQRVDAVASGDFDSSVSDRVEDEVGRLGAAVDSMAQQLRTLWNTVNQQERERLLQQIASGMAHQMRNSLTGARMAIELHRQSCSVGDDEGLDVAIMQVEQLEEYLRRLLLVGSGQQDELRPGNVLQCLQDARKSLVPLARHLRVDLDWDLESIPPRVRLDDTTSLQSAVTNLVINAMHAGSEVRVSANVEGDALLRVRVEDNGDGIAPELEQSIFEPFVTSKPEGLGLGLAVVERAAQTLGGDVVWSRDSARTRFEFCAKVYPEQTS